MFYTNIFNRVFKKGYFFLTPLDSVNQANYFKAIFSYLTKENIVTHSDRRPGEVKL